MRKPIIAANWKMYKTVGEAVDFADFLKTELKGWEKTEAVIAPSFIALAAVAKTLKESAIAVAAQDMFWEEKGAYTGEVSPVMLEDIGCSNVIIGHSERRAYFGETDETVNKKVKAVLSHGMDPIICIGESLEQREQGDTFTLIEKQLRGDLADVDKQFAGRIIIAYEPIWAIGTGKTATPEQAQEVHAFIRGLLRDIFTPSLADAMRIQYGGSVKPENINELMAQGDIDGALVGGASLEAESFVKIVKFG